MGPIIFLSIFILVLGGMGFAAFKVIKKVDPKNIDTSISSNIETAQEFLPFEEIKDGMINLGGHNYRAIIECSSTNYLLKTDSERNVIEMSFQRFLNSLTFPIVFFIQTKILDNSKMLDSLKEELLNTIKEYPQLEEHAEAYYSKMTNLNSQIGNNIQKKKYIIVPYEEAISLGNLSDEEKYQYSQKELIARVSILMDGLSSVGVKSSLLKTEDLYELIYSTYHKDNYLSFEEIANGEFTKMIVEGNSPKIYGLSHDAKIDLILYEAQMQLQNELLNENAPPIIKNNCELCIEKINELRDQTGGYFKEANNNEKPLDDEAFASLFSKTIKESEDENDGLI